MSRFKKALKKATAPIAKATTAVKNLGNAGLQPLKNLKTNPGTLFKPKALLKDNIKTGRKIGQGLEAAVVSINPLDHTLQKFNNAGIKAGGIGKFLGKTGNKVRKNPIATAAIAVATYFTAGYAASLFSGGGVVAGGSAAAVGGGAGATAAIPAAGWTAAEVSTYAGYASTALKAGVKIKTALGAKKEADIAQARADAAARAQSGQMGFFERVVHAVFG